jgi:hypothetical protein
LDENRRSPQRCGIRFATAPGEPDASGIEGHCRPNADANLLVLSKPSNREGRSQPADCRLSTVPTKRFLSPPLCRFELRPWRCPRPTLMRLAVCRLGAERANPHPGHPP